MLQPRSPRPWDRSAEDKSPSGYAPRGCLLLAEGGESHGGEGQEHFWAAASAQLLESVLVQQHPWQGMASYPAKFAMRQIPSACRLAPHSTGLEQLPDSEAGCAPSCSSWLLSEGKG